MLGAFCFALYRGVTLPVNCDGSRRSASKPVASATRRPAGNARADISGSPFASAIDNTCRQQDGNVDAPWSMATSRGLFAADWRHRPGVAVKGFAPTVKITPANAIHSIDLAKAGPILNDCDFVGYLDFVGAPPFIDSRTEPHGDRALSLRNLPDFLRLFEEYRIGATLFVLSTPAVALLDRLPDWKTRLCR